MNGWVRGWIGFSWLLLAAMLLVVASTRSREQTGRERNQQLREHLKPAAGTGATPRPTAAAPVGEASNEGRAEFAALKREFIQRRQERQEWQRLQEENQRLRRTAPTVAAVASSPTVQPEQVLTVETMSDVGFHSPQAAVQTFFHALLNADVDRLAQASPELEKELKRNPKSKESLQREAAQMRPAFGKLSILRVITDEKGRIVVEMQSGSGTPLKMPVVQVGTEWKIAGMPQ